MHPGGDILPHPLLEGECEGAVASVTALAGQPLGGERTLGCDGLTIEADEMIDAQVVDIGIVGDALSREILAEIVAVGADGFRKLGNGESMLKVELLVNATLL